MSSLWGVFIEEEEENFAQTLIVGLCFLNEDLGIDRLREVVAERMVNESFPRFRSLVRMDKNVAVMDEIPTEDMDMNYVSLSLISVLPGGVVRLNVLLCSMLRLRSRMKTRQSRWTMRMRSSQRSMILRTGCAWTNHCGACGTYQSWKMGAR